MSQSQPPASGDGDGYGGNALVGEAQMPVAHATRPAYAPASGAVPAGRHARPPARRTHAMWIAPLIAAALLIWLFTYLTLRDPFPDDARTAGRQLHLPAAVDGYVQLRAYDTGTIKDRIAVLAAGLGTTGDALAELSIVGAYSMSAGSKNPEMVFVAFPLIITPSLSEQVHKLGTAGVVAELVAGADVTSGDVRKVDPGPLGGAMSCLQSSELGTSLGLCAWADRSFVALTFITRPRSAAAVQTLALDLRNAAER